MKKYAKVSENLEGKDFVFETGKLAKQADGSVFAQVGETQVLATVVSSHESVDGDFLPLTVNYQEKAFAAGKIPGGFFKREGRPTEAETLICRLIDRPLRPMFPKNYTYPTQIIISVYSADDANPPDVLALTAASAALTVSDIPWDDPIAAVRVGRIDGELVCNPTYEEIEKADLNFIVAGSSDAILMVEGGADVALEEDIIDALMYGHDQIKKLIEFQKKLIPDDLTKREVLEKETNSDLISSVTSLVSENIKSAATIKSKQERSSAFKEAYNSALVDLENDPNFDEKEVKSIFDKIRKDSIRKMMISDKVRIDGRGFEDIRDISSEINLLPRAHGSSVFTRGETQALVAVTLGSKEDQQRVDSLIGEEKKSFMLHYNFPPFSVGEVSMRLGTGRREIGHGELAKRAVQA
ncbi:polyribonucleotide nucleotidyltransferase, partial [bacterium]|nr:polyribonucleotide nucleotidyltransferase [bacterium]